MWIAKGIFVAQWLFGVRYTLLADAHVTSSTRSPTVPTCSRKA